MGIELQDRDRQILDHIGRYGMTMTEVLATMPYFRGVSRDAIKKVTGRLKKARLIATKPLYGQRHYWYLTPSGCKLVSDHEHWGRELKEEAKIRAFATLYFCCMNQPRRTRLTASELKSAYPTLFTKGMRLDYYLDVDAETGTPRLGYLRIDKGGTGHWTRLISDLHRFIRKRCDNPDFVRLISSDRFVLTVVTAFETKADRLLEAFNEEHFGVPVNAHVVPDLFHLVAPFEKPTKTLEAAHVS